MNGAQKIEQKLRAILENSLYKQDYNLSMSCITALAQIHYEKNQEYISDYLEKALEQIKRGNLDKCCNEYLCKNKVILFYDGMGQDTRGLALTYLEAINSYADRIVYVTNERIKNRQPTIIRFLEENNAIIEYVSESLSHMERTIRIISLIEEYAPSDTFMYTLPYDASGILAFMLAEKTTRYKIDFTDHAFWLGLNAFDYCIEFREYGVTIATEFRKIEENKILLLPFYPRIIETEFKGFDFDIDGKKLIFSGGALYKTYSEDRLYYKIVDSILYSVEDVVFYYAGSGNTEEISKLIRNYPGRVFYSEERVDFFEVIKRSVIYLNTYPLLGGLMTQYAVAAGKLPITLLHDQDGSGFLLNAEKTGVFYSEYSLLVEDVKKMLVDEKYLKEKELNISDCLMTKSKFEKEIAYILENKKGTLSCTKIDIDVKRLHEEYLARFSNEKVIDAVAKIRNKPLLRYFPILLIRRIIRRLK